MSAHSAKSSKWCEAAFSALRAAIPDYTWSNERSALLELGDSRHDGARIEIFAIDLPGPVDPGRSFLRRAIYRLWPALGGREELQPFRRGRTVMSAAAQMRPRRHTSHPLHGL